MPSFLSLKKRAGPNFLKYLKISLFSLTDLSWLYKSKIVLQVSFSSINSYNSSNSIALSGLESAEVIVWSLKILDFLQILKTFRSTHLTPSSGWSFSNIQSQNSYTRM